MIKYFKRLLVFGVFALVLPLCVKADDFSVNELLDNINCYNCEAIVYNNSSVVSSGNIPTDSELVVKENISGNSDILKSVPINFAVTDVSFDDSTLKEI